MITSKSGLAFSIEWMNNTQKELRGVANVDLSQEIAEQLSNSGFTYNPEFSFTPHDERVLSIVVEAMTKVTGEQDPPLARVMAKELCFEGVHLPQE